MHGKNPSRIRPINRTIIHKIPRWRHLQPRPQRDLIRPDYRSWAEPMTKPTTTLLEEWMRLTELEYQCIASKEWNELNDLLDKKDRIKSLLSDYDSEEYSPSDRTLLDELVCRTKRNQELLESAMEEVRHLIGTQDKSLKNIQNVNQAYGAKSSQSFWHSYS